LILSGLGNRSEISAGRRQILSIFQADSCSIGQELGEIWIIQTDLQQIYSKPDRMLTEICFPRHDSGQKDSLFENTKWKVAQVLRPF